MAFILSGERDADVVQASEKYRRYLEEVRPFLPESVFTLATSDWYFAFNDPRCPHDAWLECATIGEPSSGERHEIRSTSLRIRLRNGYHNGFIEFFYPQVFRYRLDASDATAGHRDWRYDEFRLSDDGHVLHEIEWWGPDETSRWLIEASDVRFQWFPDEGITP
jgi:hypothetical protein